MESFLEQFDSRSSNQIVVLTVSSLGHYSIADFATGVGHSWGVGQNEFDNGVVVALLPKTKNNDGEVFIATGYGLEAVLTDAVCKRIIEQEMLPYFRMENYYAGLIQALSTIQQLAEGEISTDTYAYTPAGEDEWTEEDMPGVYIILGIFFAIIIGIGIFGKDPDSSGTTLSGGRSYSSRSSSSSWGGSSRGGGGSFLGGGFGGGGAGGRW